MAWTTCAPFMTSTIVIVREQLRLLASWPATKVSFPLVASWKVRELLISAFNSLCVNGIFWLLNRWQDCDRLWRHDDYSLGSGGGQETRPDTRPCRWCLFHVTQSGAEHYCHRLSGSMHQTVGRPDAQVHPDFLWTRSRCQLCLRKFFFFKSIFTNHDWFQLKTINNISFGTCIVPSFRYSLRFGFGG